MAFFLTSAIISSMATAHFPEKDLRKHPRVEAHIKAEYRFYTPGNEKAPSSFVTQNVSAGGLMFHSDRYIKPGTEVELKLFLENELVECSGKVVWTEKRLNPLRPNTPYAIGLQYTKISPQSLERISQQTLRLIQVR